MLAKGNRSKQVKEACKKLNVSVLFVTHDLGLVAELADRVVVMYRGKVIEQKDTLTLFQKPEHPYVKALIACRPTLENSSNRLPTVDDFINSTSSNQKDTAPSTSPPFLNEKKILLETKGLTVEFTSRDRNVRAVDDVNLAIREGTTHGLVGESGSGKTTLGRSILQLIKKLPGRFYFTASPSIWEPLCSNFIFERPCRLSFKTHMPL